MKTISIITIILVFAVECHAQEKNIFYILMGINTNQIPMPKFKVIVWTIFCLGFFLRPGYTQTQELKPKGEFSIDISPDQVNLEFVGIAGLASINYEHTFENYFGYRVGIGFTPIRSIKDSIVAQYPKLAGAFVLAGEHHYGLSKTWYVKSELGIVGLMTFNNRPRWIIAPDSSDIYPFLLSGAIGIEYIRDGGGLTASLTLTPYMSLPKVYIKGLFGISIGYAF